MNLAAISHRSASPDAYALNEKETVINLQTGKGVTAVSIIHPTILLPGEGLWGAAVPV